MPILNLTNYLVDDHNTLGFAEVNPGNSNAEAITKGG